MFSGATRVKWGTLFVSDLSDRQWSPLPSLLSTRTYRNGIDVYLWPCVRVSSGSCKTRFLGIVLAAAVCQKCNWLVLL